MVEQRTLNPLADSSSLSWPTAKESEGLGAKREAQNGGGRRLACTPVDEAELRAAIDRLTGALAMAGDDVIAELVSERRALRKELGEADVRNVVQFYQRPLANFIHAQMEPHFWQKATAFDARVHLGLRGAAASDSERRFAILLEDDGTRVRPS